MRLLGVSTTQLQMVGGNTAPVRTPWFQAGAPKQLLSIPCSSRRETVTCRQTAWNHSSGAYHCHRVHLHTDLKLCSDSWTSLLTEMVGCVCCQADTRQRDDRAVASVTLRCTHSWKRLLHFPTSTLAFHPCCQYEW